MQLAPVIVPINLIIAKDIKTIISPAIAYVNVFLAPSTCFGSPPEVKNFIPENTIKNTAVSPASAIAQSTILLKTTGRQLNVATPPCTQLPQSIN